MRFGVVVFPGSNCDQDCYYALRDAAGAEVEYLWHESRDISGFDAIVLPGGFSYGDYLREGAIARFSPVMEAIIEKASGGLPVLGICNGFQVLTEAGLLPGALLRNDSLRFICRPVKVRVEGKETPFTAGLGGRVLRVPIAHGTGRYYADEETLAALEGEGRVVFRYCDDDGEATEEANPNGSANNIAGISNEGGNVVGLMPHPERAADDLLGSADGLGIFLSAIKYLEGVGR